jgi:hypothetical protein
MYRNICQLEVPKHEFSTQACQDNVADVSSKATSRPGAQMPKSFGKDTSKSYSKQGPINANGLDPGFSNQRQLRKPDHLEILHLTTVTSVGVDLLLPKNATMPAEMIPGDKAEASLQHVADAHPQGVDRPRDVEHHQGVAELPNAVDVDMMMRDTVGVDLLSPQKDPDQPSILTKEICETDSMNGIYIKITSNLNGSKSCEKSMKERAPNPIRILGTKRPSQPEAPREPQEKGVDLLPRKRRKIEKLSLLNTNCQLVKGLDAAWPTMRTPPGLQEATRVETRPHVKGTIPSNPSPSSTSARASNDQRINTSKNSLENLKISCKNRPKNPNVRGNKIIFWNCSNGLISKLDCVKELIKQFCPYVIFISEAELSNEDQIKACAIAKYTLHVSKGFDMWRARSCCYIIDGFDFKRVDPLESSELIVVESTKLKLRLGGFYRPFTPPPGKTIKDIDEELFRALTEACVTHLDVLFGGDMNIDLMKYDKRSLELQEWISSNALVQHVNEITRHRSVTLANGNNRIETSLLDHVYSSYNDITINTQSSEFSDHDAIIVNLPVSFETNSNKRCTVKTRDWTKYSMDALIGNMSGSNLETFARNLDTSYNTLVPIRTCRVKEGEIVNPHLEKMKKKRDRLVKKFKTTGRKVYYDEAKALGKSIKKDYKKRKKENIQKRATSSNPKSFWNVINQLLGKNHANGLMLNMDGKIVKDPKTLASLFLNFFRDKVYNLSDLDIRPIIIPEHDKQESISFTMLELEEAIKKVPPKKCFGTDGIPLLVARDFVIGFKELALEIFNDAAKRFPVIWKTARVLPLHKKGSKDDINNYRPISNLNSMAKIYEKLLLAKLENETEGLEGSSQHGFRKNFSTSTAAVELQSIIAKTLDQGKAVGVYSVDLSSAFDLLRVDTFDKVMSGKLSNGLRKAIIDFLTDRKITVEVDGEKSAEMPLEIGCVQGSTLGPRLFTLYINEIRSKIDADHFICYADDGYVLVSGENATEVSEKIKTISAKHLAYLQTLGMKANPSKTEVVFFIKKGPSLILDVDIGGTIVKSQSTMKVLGVHFDDKLTWEYHIRQLVKKANSKLSVLRRIKKYFNTAQFLRILTAQFFSIIYYGSPVWLSSTTKAYLWKLINSIHYKALRIAVSDHKNTINREKLDSLCQRAPPRQWSKYAISNLVIKALTCNEPQGIVNFLKETLYTERRSQMSKFYNNAKGKVGRQKIGNSLEFMNAIKDKWLGENLRPDAIRRLLKKTFFSYITN